MGQPLKSMLADNPNYPEECVAAYAKEKKITPKEARDLLILKGWQKAAAEDEYRAKQLAKKGARSRKAA